MHDTAKTLLNNPSNEAFTMKTIMSLGVHYPAQMLITMDFNIYFRRSTISIGTPSSWSEWRKIL